MSDIRIDLDRMARATDRLNTVLYDFEGVQTAQTDLPGAIGHVNLAQVVTDFRTAWDVRRGELVEELQFVRDAAEAIHDTFEEIDKDLVTRLDAVTAPPEGP